VSVSRAERWKGGRQGEKSSIEDENRDSFYWVDTRERAIETVEVRKRKSSVEKYPIPITRTRAGAFFRGRKIYCTYVRFVYYKLGTWEIRETEG